jgi:hypothetical protein
VNGPPLTPQEAVASVARQVRRREAQGLDGEEAIRRASDETGIDPEKVRWCAQVAFPNPLVYLSPARRRGWALSIAAAF